MKYVICVDNRDQISMDRLIQQLEIRDMELLDYPRPLNDSREGFYFTFRKQLDDGVLDYVVYMNALLTNKEISFNDNFLYDFIIDENQYVQLLDLVKAYEQMPYCDFVNAYGIQSGFTNDCAKCVALACKHRTESFIFSRAPNGFVKLFETYLDKCRDEVDRLILEPKCDMFTYLFRNNKLNNTDYLVRDFIRNYYNDNNRMMSFLTRNIDLILYYNASRILSGKDIICKYYDFCCFNLL